MKVPLFFTAIATALTVAAVPARASDPVPVEIWTGGDDGLTQRLRDAIEERLRASGSFTLPPSGSDPGALKIAIPQSVEWERVGTRTRVRYQLEFRRGDRVVGAFQGNCWAEELSVCARQVLFATTSANDAN